MNTAVSLYNDGDVGFEKGIDVLDSVSSVHSGKSLKRLSLDGG